jgi:predicted dehydrogenase
VTGREIGVAVAAYGSAARIFHVPLLQAIPGMVLRTVVSRRPDKVRAALPAVSAVADFAAACADPEIDLVVVPTPNATHAPLAAQALAAAKHVVVDKPFTVTVAEAEALLAQARAAGRLLSVFQNRRWDSDFLTLRGLLAAGAVGVPTHLESHFDRFRPQVPDRWRDRAGPGAGLWYDLGPHLIDQAVQLFGPPRAVFLDLAAQRDGATADDWFHALLRYDRLRVVLHATALAAAETPRFVLHGTAGSWVKYGLDTQEEALKAGAAPSGHGWGVDPRPGRLSTAPGTVDTPGVPGDYRRYYLAVRDAIAGKCANPVTPADALTVMRVIELGRRSHEARRELSLDRV